MSNYSISAQCQGWGAHVLGVPSSRLLCVIYVYDFKCFRAQKKLGIRCWRQSPRLERYKLVVMEFIQMSKNNSGILIHLGCYILGTCNLVQASQLQNMQQNSTLELVFKAFFFICLYFFIRLLIGFCFDFFFSAK